MAKVLFIEPDPSLRHFYKTAIRLRGHEPVVVRDVFGALELWKNDCPEVAVIDVEQHPADARLVKKSADLKKRPKIILLAEFSPRRLQRELKPEAVLRKPLDFDQLVEVVEQLAA